jgi:pimeloyl-ACP methyl ester carboxylesterase
MRGFDHVSGNHIDIDDAKIYYEMIGNESHPPILFLHGGLGNIEDFNEIITKLPNKFRVIGVDSRGHGKSTLGSKDLTYELLQNDIELIINHLNIKKFNILGFSNGGTIAYRLASFTNLPIEKLITIGAPWSNQHVQHLFQAYSELTSDIWKEACPSVFETYQRVNPHPEFDKLFRQSTKMALDISPASRPNTAVKNIHCPTLIMRGENDPVVSASDIIELAKLIENARILNIPYAGHEAFQDQAQVLTEELLNFIGDAKSAAS